MELLSTRDSWWMTQCEALLLAEGVEARWVSPWPAAARGAQSLDVAESDHERVVDMLSEQLGDELKKQSRPRTPWVPLLLQPAFAAALCLAVLLIVFHAWFGGSDSASAFYRAGALRSAAFAHGEWWRVITAATLHADWGHVLGNAAFILVLGWAASERFGAGLGVFVWLATAVLGFGASLLFSKAGSTVGASGGLFGLLGAAGAHAARWVNVEHFPRRERLRTGGAAVLLLAFTAFSPEANIAAHVGGFVAGAALGGALPGRPMRASWQLGAAIVTAIVLALGWHFALD